MINYSVMRQTEHKMTPHSCKNYIGLKELNYIMIGVVKFFRVIEQKIVIKGGKNKCDS